MSTESKNQTRWRKLERVVLWFDGLVMLVSLLLVLGIALLPLIDQASAFRSVYSLVSGIFLVVLAVSFLPPYLGMRRRIRWRWVLHLLPFLTLWALEGPLNQLMPSTRLGPVNEFYENGSPGMEPTLREGELVGVRLLQDQDSIQRGDIVVFKAPIGDNPAYVKRVIAVAGDVIKIEEDQVYLDGQPLQEDYVVYVEQDSSIYDSSFSPSTVPKDSFFVMGDNRNNSLDSRYFGFIPRDDILALVANKEGP